MRAVVIYQSSVQAVAISRSSANFAVIGWRLKIKSVFDNKEI